MFKDLFSSRPRTSIENINNSKINVTQIENFNVHTDDHSFENPRTQKTTKEKLNDDSKHKFIGNIERKEIYISRNYDTESLFDVSTYHFLPNQDDQTLTYITAKKENKKLILLGNAGLGKTYELEKLTLDIWNDKSDTRIPIYSNLKNFTTQNTVENFIYQEWKNISNPIYIFDGIDEIQHIQDFISKLQNFITKLEKDDIEFSIVVSCRTNIYEKIVKNIQGFKALYLLDLPYHKGMELLEKKCGSIVHKLRFDVNSNTFLRNPYQIKVLSDYINTHGKLPANRALLWTNYIEERFKEDTTDKLKKSKLNTSLIRSFSKKISLINELCHTNVFNEDQIFKIAKGNSSDTSDFSMNPLIDKMVNSEEWYFEHRNIQEYFAALMLSELEINEIIAIIDIEGTETTNPSLFNTISFLINLLDKDSPKYQNLLVWFQENEPELLFKAESERLTNEIREAIFQNYFNKKCIEQTLWISMDRIFSVPEIAVFGSVPSNFSFLLNIIRNSESHNRAVISAIELLSYFILPEDSIDLLKSSFLEVLEDPDFSISVKAKIVDCIGIQNLAVTDNEYLATIFDIFSEDTGNEINNSLLTLIKDHKNPDNFFAFIHDEFRRVHKITLRTYADDVHRGNEYKVLDLVLALKSKENFLKITSYFFDKKHGFSRSSTNTFLESFATKCIEFAKIDNSFIDSLLSTIEDPLLFLTHHRVLKAIITKSKTEDRAIKFLLKNSSLEDILHFIACILNDNSLKLVKDRLIALELPAGQIEKFRNDITYDNSSELAEKFQKIMVKAGVRFKEKIFTEKDRRKFEIALQRRRQDNLNLLFTPKKLIKKIKTIFRRNRISSLTSDQLYEIERNWREQNHYSPYIIQPIATLRDLLYKYKFTQFQQIETALLTDEFYLYNEVKNKIQDYDKNNTQYSISKNQRLAIQKWCQSICTTINFEKLITWVDSGGYNLHRDIEKLELLYFFMEHFDFDFEQSFLLDSIAVFDLGRHTDSRNLEELFNAINDKTLFDERIIKNLTTKKLVWFSLVRHIDYALENNLTEAYPAIREYLTGFHKHHNESKRLRLYLEKSSDITVLKDCCEIRDSSICWSAIELLTERGMEKNFTLRIARDYLDSGETIFISNALRVLFYWNEIDAIQQLINVVDNGLLRVLADNNFTKYNTVEDYNILDELYTLFYQKSTTKDLEDRLGKTFMETYVSNLSVTSEGYDAVQSILTTIKERLKGAKEDLFYINLLIEISTKKYINAQSDSYTFKDAFNLVEKLAG